MKILHFSDLHLDHAFVKNDPSTHIGRERRESLIMLLNNICDIAHEESVDAVTIAGDLFDEETVMPNTLQALVSAFERLAPIPVLVAPGQSDVLDATSLYMRWTFPANVHIFASTHLAGYHVAQDLTVWGSAWDGTALGDRINDFEPAMGKNLLLVYASDAVSQAESEASPAQALEQGLFDYSLFGGNHCLTEFEDGVYPGSPEALEPYPERCSHGVVLLTVDGDTLTTKFLETGHWTYEVDNLDVSSCANQHDVEKSIMDAFNPVAGRQVLRIVTLTGEAHCAIDIDQLRERISGHVVIRRRLSSPHDLKRVMTEPTVRGLLVRRFSEQIGAAEPAQRDLLSNALQLTLQVLDGIEEPNNAIDPS